MCVCLCMFIKYSNYIPLNIYVYPHVYLCNVFNLEILIYVQMLTNKCKQIVRCIITCSDSINMRFHSNIYHSVWMGTLTGEL